MPEERPAQWVSGRKLLPRLFHICSDSPPPLTLSFSSLEQGVVPSLVKVAQLDFPGWGPPDNPELGGRKALWERCCRGVSRLAWKQSVVELSARGT